MNRIFLSYSFDNDRSKELARTVETIVRSFGALPVTGEILGGGGLTKEVKDSIDKCDGLVAVMMPIVAPGGQETNQTTPWVRDEMNFARASDKPSIAVVHEIVDTGGMYEEHERINYDPDGPLPAVIKLIQTIGYWKVRAGRVVKVRIQPDEVGVRAARANGGASCSFRLYKDRSFGKWQKAEIIHEAGGAFAYLPGVREESLIELKIEIGNESWHSPAMPQWVYVKLQQ